MLSRVFLTTSTKANLLVRTRPVYADASSGGAVRFGAVW